MADASRQRSEGDYSVTLAASAAVGEVRQLGNGLAAVYKDNSAAGSGERKAYKTDGLYTVVKAAGVVLLDGGEVFWDHSANNATYKRVSDRDFYLGRVVGDAASADTTCTVALNSNPRYDLDLARDGFQTVLVGTPAAGGFGYPVNLGGSLVFELSATSEAQKVDALGVDGFSKDANAIVDIVFRVLSDGAGSAPDVSVGIANATHASDADSITESLFVHLNGNDTNIYLESDDGTTEVVATDSTIDYTEGSALASRVYVTFDLRNPADVQVYVNGANVLPGSVFNVNVAAGPLFPLVHVEKTSAADVYKIAVDSFKVRFAEQ